jgi:hypothetical protein
MIDMSMAFIACSRFGNNGLTPFMIATKEIYVDAKLYDSHPDLVWRYEQPRRGSIGHKQGNGKLVNQKIVKRFPYK